MISPCLCLVWLGSAGLTGTKWTHSKHEYISVSSACIILYHNTAHCNQRSESQHETTKPTKEEKRPNLVGFAVTMTHSMSLPAFSVSLYQRGDVAASTDQDPDSQSRTVTLFWRLSWVKTLVFQMWRSFGYYSAKLRRERGEPSRLKQARDLLNLVIITWK